MNCNSKSAHSSYSYHHSSTSYSSSSYNSSSSSSYSRNGGLSSSSTGALPADHCAVRFVPRENGVHQIHIRQNAVPVAGSPFNVLVGKVDADPAKVGAYGDGLSKGRTCKLTAYFVKSSLRPYRNHHQLQLSRLSRLVTVTDIQLHCI